MKLSPTEKKVELIKRLRRAANTFNRFGEPVHDCEDAMGNDYIKISSAIRIASKVLKL